MKDQYIYIDPGGNKFYYSDKAMTVLHRTDGPAVEHANGNKYWYLEGKEYSEKEYLAKMNPESSCEGKIIEVDGKKYKLVSAWEIIPREQMKIEPIMFALWLSHKKGF